jgi:murein DD-endopeptidase MepM/ murein hydrolase activator NlpD
MVENSLTVVKGEKVKAGTRLGIMGNTGASAGRHLHFEICKGKFLRWTSDGKGYVDPLKFVKATIAKWELDAQVGLATPDTGEVLPAPVHEPVKVIKVPKTPEVKNKSAK